MACTSNVDSLLIEQRNELITRLKEIQELKHLLENERLDKKDQFTQIMLDVIDILDNYDRVEEVIKEKQLNSDENSLAIVKRFETIKKKLLKVLLKNGITEIEFPDHRLVVGLCKVLDTEPDPNQANDTIIEIVKKGYIRGKELVREAEVIIVKN